ncbi:MAG: hypothetical protein DMF68_18140 [Acidobacteria bacterium]|nr:MAG: hypothetical protein DMF68_18140 [Acidobacteriota bacterium]
MELSLTDWESAKFVSAFFGLGKGIVCCSHRCGNVRNNRIARVKYQGNPTEYKLQKFTTEKREKGGKGALDTDEN